MPVSALVRTQSPESVPALACGKRRKRCQRLFRELAATISPTVSNNICIYIYMKCDHIYLVSEFMRYRGASVDAYESHSRTPVPESVPQICAEVCIEKRRRCGCRVVAGKAARYVHRCQCKV